MEKLQRYWWHNRPATMTCEKQDDQSDGPCIQNICNAFIAIFMGIGLPCITLALGYWFFEWRKHRIIGDFTKIEPAKIIRKDADSTEAMSSPS